MLPFIELFGVKIHSYSLMGGIGFFALWLVAWLVTRKRKDVDQTQVPHIELAAIGGLFVGGHLLYAVINLRIFIAAVRDHFSLIHSYMDVISLIVSVFGGMVFYGGLFGAIVGAAWYMKSLKLPSYPYMDIMAFCIPLFHGFARIGCFLGGCCYGIKWKYGITFQNSLDKTANGVPRFPVQLLESGIEFALFAVILLLYFKKKLSGKLIYFYLLSYAVVRFFDEFLRGDPARGFVGPLSTSQFISLLMFAAVLLILAIKNRKKKTCNIYQE